MKSLRCVLPSRYTQADQTAAERQREAGAHSGGGALKRCLREQREQDGGLLWNLSSHDLLKEHLSKEALEILTTSVLVPCSGLSEGENPKDGMLADPDTFYNATGCLRPQRTVCASYTISPTRWSFHRSMPASLDSTWLQRTRPPAVSAPAVPKSSRLFWSYSVLNQSALCWRRRVVPVGWSGCGAPSQCACTCQSWHTASVPTPRRLPSEPYRTSQLGTAWYPRPSSTP